MTELLALGVSHKTAPVEVRERLALPDARAADFLRDLRGTAYVREAERQLVAENTFERDQPAFPDPEQVFLRVGMEQ